MLLSTGIIGSYAVPWKRTTCDSIKHRRIVRSCHTIIFHNPTKRSSTRRKMPTKQIYYILILGFHALMSLADPIDWCSLDCVKPNNIEKNTMCSYRPQTEIANCKHIKDSNTVDKRKVILHLHNQFRNAMAAGEKKGWPAAANMRQMTWDYTLEAVALRWAQQCKPGNDDCRLTPEFKVVGQNYGMVANSDVNPESSIGSFEGWVDEISLANPSIVDSFQNGGWAHFTQVAWAESYKVGCAQVQFTEDESGTEWYRTVLICNYGPMGNFISSPMYQKGDACTKCPRGWRCKPGSPYAQLCQPVEQGGGSGGGEGILVVGLSASGRPAYLDPILMVFTLFTAK